MKITQIEVQNILGAKSVSVCTKAPVIVFAGDNYSGKSSTCEAIYQAMSENYTRVGLKKDFSKLVSDDQKKGIAVVQFEGGQASISLPKGTHNFAFDGISMNDAELMQLAMPYCLTGSFSSADSDERRKFLYKMMKVKTGIGIVQKMLIDEGCDESKLPSILPLLASGFKAAEEEAKEKAKDSRTLWKSVTKEVYGSDKAETWENTLPAGLDNSAVNIDAINQSIVDHTKQIEERTIAIGKLQAEMQQAATIKRKADELSAIAATLPFSKESLENDRKALADFQAEIAAVRELASGEIQVTTYSCPCCSVVLTIADGALSEYRAPEKVIDPAAQEKLPGMERKLKLLEAAVIASENAVEDAEDAKSKLKLLADGVNSDAPTIESIAAERKALDAINAQLSKLKLEKANYDALLTAEAEARKKTEDAKRHHLDVLAYSKIAEQLSPEGIPSKLLENAIAPFNQALAKSSEISYWHPVSVDKNMSVFYGDRPYSLCSESEKWRCDAMLAEVIAKFSGLKLIMLDRFDCLNAEGRSDMIAWLEEITASGSIDSAIVFGTMKDKPKLPSTCQLVWMINGENEQDTQQQSLVAA
ncbi:hypothetical protein [Undibacterium crateris]|uniref:hypothetical protein n=1 Tax=Undibacterium crateris TaxID=2528175 RepID=UPI001389A420|nr:hypothetical protein [Undibacterium crateris]NDI85122.1 hypothetical protein [Undibacterium crateris]